MTPDATPLTQSTALTTASAGAPFTAGPVWGGLGLLALAVVAFLLSRRRARVARRLELVESMSLGPRRSMCLARVDGRLLVLGVSEAGVQLLTQYDAPASAEEAEPSDVSEPAEALAFENLLVESTAEQELRARFSAARLNEVAP
ncbi:MAG: flagellar biosynthetic protein FliO [Myxococcales bacterium]|nr:flagellar biosynthetic protein FliO [Myxococcales bacterium]